MKRLGTMLVVGSLLFVAGCAKSEPPAVSAPEASPPVAEKEEVTEEVVVADTAPTEAKPEADSEPVPAEDSQGSTAARPSLLLGLMLQPLNVAIESTMASVQGVVGPITSGGIPGLPRAETPAAETAKDSESAPADAAPAGDTPE
jgi:hypothetical protein